MVDGNVLGLATEGKTAHCGLTLTCLINFFSYSYLVK